MGLLRRGTAGTGEPAGVDDVYVVSEKAAGHAAKAEKEKRRAAKADRKLAEARAKDTKGKKGKGAPEPVTGATVKRYLGIARVVVPVLAPLVYQAAGEARARWDGHKARQLGVSPDQLADFSGRGAALYARIHHLALSVRDLRARRSDDRETTAFADDTERRLTDLEAAVRSAEQMPSARRRSAHVAVAEELDRLETRLLSSWGVGGAGNRTGALPAGAPGDAPSVR